MLLKFLLISDINAVEAYNATIKIVKRKRSYLYHTVCPSVNVGTMRN